MILQRLISEATRIPDLSQEVTDAINVFNDLTKVESDIDLEKLFTASVKQFQAENVRRTKADLKTMEMSIIRAKHAPVDDDEDFI